MVLVHTLRQEQEFILFLSIKIFCQSKSQLNIIVNNNSMFSIGEGRGGSYQWWVWAEDRMQFFLKAHHHRLLSDVLCSVSPSSLHFLLPSFCHVHLSSSAVPVSSVSQKSSRCCLGGKDSCTLLSSCALDQSVLAVPNIKHKIPLWKACPGLKRSGRTRICPAGKKKFLELHLAPCFGCSLPSDLWKAKFWTGGQQDSSTYK